MPTIEIGKVRPGPNTRIFFEDIVELAKLIEESEWVSPITLDETGEIKAGERRYRACCYLNDVARRKGDEIPWPEIPYEEFEGNEEEAFLRNVAENAGRQELRFIEWARIFEVYRDKYKYDNARIAKVTGYEETTVSRYLAILKKTHPDIIKRLDNGDKIPVNLLITLHQIPKQEVQLARLDQWYGKPNQENETQQKSKERVGSLSRKKLLKLLRILQDREAQSETVEVVMFIAGLRQKLPNNWHLLLSRKKPPQARE